MFFVSVFTYFVLRNINELDIFRDKKPSQVSILQGIEIWFFLKFKSGKEFQSLAQKELFFKLNQQLLFINSN